MVKHALQKTQIRFIMQNNDASSSQAVKKPLKKIMIMTNVRK